MTRKEKQQTVGATETSLAILEHANEKNGTRLADVVEQFNVSKSTAHTHLTTLRKQGYLSKYGKVYQLGMKLWHLGNRARQDRWEYGLAEQAVERLAERTQEEAEFDVEENGQLISVFSRMGNNNEPTFESGQCFNLHTTATGKAILAELPEEQRDYIIERQGLHRETDKTITTKTALEADIEIIQERGYAVNDEELRDGLRAVGAAVRYPDERILGGLSVGGPLYRINREYLTGELADELLRVVDELEQKLDSAGLHQR